MQAKISGSTLALRAALLKRQQKQQAAIAALVVQPGCNRTVDMQYAFVVRHDHIYHTNITRLSKKLHQKSTFVSCTLHLGQMSDTHSAWLRHKHTSQLGTEV